MTIYSVYSRSADAPSEARPDALSQHLPGLDSQAVLEVPSALPLVAPAQADVRQTAADIVADVAARLSDTAHVLNVTGASANHVLLAGTRRSPWHPARLSEGHPSLVLLFAELFGVDGLEANDALEAAGGARALVHDHLTAALTVTHDSERLQLFDGPVSAAFAAHAAARSLGGYQGLLGQLDERISGAAYARAVAARAEIEAGEVAGDFRRYDVIGGLAGVTRHLLARLVSAPEASRQLEQAVRAGLETLVAIGHGPAISQDEFGDGHRNLSLAHGIAGPLALLAVAERAGVRVPGQRESMELIGELLWRWSSKDEHGEYWTPAVGAEDLAGGAARSGAECGGARLAEGLTGVGARSAPRGRDAWCCGTAGVARALYLAGTVLGNAEWQWRALDALSGIGATLDDTLIDASLCHGWAGILRITQLCAAESGDSRIGALRDRAAAALVQCYEPDSPFGFRYRAADGTQGPDRPGFLLGAAGIVLVLNAYVTGAAPRTEWDAALLLG